ncbi:hypothetical protein D9757_001143 [Collybiopsis confluens]|uniref:Protein AF-9 homolog n=1 Tax=Collybiopsis confluens TaxID=2823264 RepID=A0A8H5MFW3_9AGAR|nr:hypothetical protein D9757_001143 [Collybiopsis confluens]
MANAERVRVRNLSIFRPIIYGNTATLLTADEKDKYPAEHTHKWTVAVRSAASAPGSDIVGGADNLAYFIKRVSFKLHDTYANPTRSKLGGWGEFEIQIRMNFIAESGEKAMVLYHHLKLHPWALTGESEIPPLDIAIKAGPVHSWQYDEIVFNDPYQNFLNILTNHPPTPLPRTKTTKPIPFHVANPGSLEASKGGLPEFTAQMEKDEADRLEEAKRAIIAEQEKTRSILIVREKELERHKKILDM